MRKLLIILLSPLMFYAQEQNGFWVLFGGNQSIFNTNLGTFSNKQGLNYGIGWTSGDHEKFNFLIEIFKEHNNVEIQNNNRKSKFDFGGAVTLGIYPNYYIVKPEENKIYFGLQAGLYGSYGNLSSKEDFYTEDIYQNGISGIDLLQYYKKFNYGVGTGFTAGYNSFKLNLRYNFGLSERFNFTNEFQDINIKTKHSNISLTLMYRIFTGN